jgi:hypothetical protein
MDRSVTLVLPLLLLLLSCQPEQVLSPQDLNESRTTMQRLAYQKQEERAKEKVEAGIRSRCQSNETVITLKRTPGYTTPGFAVAYDLAVCGDGTVVYRGYGCLQAQRAQRAKIDPAEVQRLVQAFLNADYLGMADHHPSISDASGAYTSLTHGKRHKPVENYEEAGPQELKQLEDMIDKVAGSNRWVNIDAAGVQGEGPERMGHSQPRSWAPDAESRGGGRRRYGTCLHRTGR